MSDVKNFLVSTADFAYYVDGVLACTGNTNLNTSIEVSMEEQDVNAGKGNKLIYSYKYGRKLSATLEAADWKLEYIAMIAGTKITEGMKDVYSLGECVTLTKGIGIVGKTPIGDVAVELPNGNIVTVKPDGTSIDLTAFGITDDTASVKATYQYSKKVKSIPIDTDSNPTCGRLVLDADRYNNKLGKVGKVQIEIPSYQLNGNFNIEFTSEGVTSTSLEGKALAIEGESCKDGGVYAHIYEWDDTEEAASVYDIAATPGVMNLDTTANTTDTISVIGMKGSLYNPIELDNADCTFVSDTTSVATVDASGTVTAVSAGTAKITVTYNGISDDVTVNVA